MVIIEIIASLFGGLSVYLYIVRNHWAWPIGLVQVVLFVAVFAQSKLYADMILHIVYAVLQLYGWWSWSSSSTLTPDSGQRRLLEPVIEVRRLRTIENCAAIGAVAAMTVLFATLLSHYTDASLPLPDSFISAASLAAQMLLAWRYIESWLYWIVVDVVAIALFGYKGLVFTAGLYCVFLVMAIMGYRAWHAQMELRRSPEAVKN